MIRGKGIAALYEKGGVDMLTYRIGPIFAKIEKGDDEARVRHNDAVAEVLDLINKDCPDQTGRLLAPESKLLTFIAEYLLYKNINREKRFLFALSKRILHLSKLKG